jgi:hypothetical protein
MEILVGVLESYWLLSRTGQDETVVVMVAVVKAHETQQDE